ncbi:class II glutamine amidotransferase [Rhodococcus oxybenzonivorans]|uniref:Class II glutamine amidotransferase n=1 Tax=Rhodococcus oxybenzonivorans TaxID=1990687 RepID=A0A2S2C4I6_9NOCA|nr:class II glutamine amidotransferase [Rhodococcus oxybenzonivorans]AWK75742.1 class II glutamine amidotransferase [Rhodococcus oxybenzonivorans]
MCRLFGLSAAPHRVRASFWLLDAPDSLTQQSHREPDGTGLGTFAEDGTPVVEKQPLAAYEDTEFAQEVKHRYSSTFVAHIRFATTGELLPANTHPFTLRGRIFAHNGVIGNLAALDTELGSDLDLVEGDTDSERFFALVTRHIDRNGGDVTAGISTAAQWVAGNLPVYALNLVLTTPEELWALRYPDTHDLLVLERRPGGPSGSRHLQHTSSSGRVRARSEHLAQHSAVIVASEQMDEDPGWTPLRPGELLHVDRNLTVSREVVLDRPPRDLIHLDDLDSRAAAAQLEK